MSASTWPEQDTERAMQFWAEYQKTHDISGQLGQKVGIDPHTGEVFFGESAIEIGKRLEDQGIFRPLYYLEVGKDYYQRKRKLCDSAPLLTRERA